MVGNLYMGGRWRWQYAITIIILVQQYGPLMAIIKSVAIIATRYQVCWYVCLLLGTPKPRSINIEY